VDREVVALLSDDFVVEVAPSAGGSITRYAWNGGSSPLELLRPAAADDLAVGTATGMACFPLVPFSNRVRNGKFTFRGRAIQLEPNFPPEPHAIHGHGWQSVWEVVDRSETELAIAYSHEADGWVWPYRAEQHYSLSSEALEVMISVTNTGTDAMPAGLGLHPYFVRTPGSRLETKVESVWLSDEGSMPTDLVPVPDEWDLEGLDPNEVSLDHNFAGWSGNAVIDWPDREARLILTAGSPLEFLVVFTPPGEDFFCVEPVANTLDAFNLVSQGRTDVGSSVVEPGERLAGRVRFAPEIHQEQSPLTP
jgi:aldose 1-epimerase